MGKPKGQTKMEFLTQAQAAAKLGVTPARISQLYVSGKLKAAAMVGERIPLFAPEDIERIKAAKIADLIQKVEKLKST